MLKFLFFDNWGYEVVTGFERELQRAVKDPRNPLFVAELPWEFGNLELYGSVVKVEGQPFQMWYSTIEPRWHIKLGYAESEDGLAWRRPAFDIYTHEGQKTNIVLASDVHGPAVIYDERDPRPDWKYKLVCGAEPTDCVYAYHSAAGIHWEMASPEPIINNKPDCPMALLRRPDGTYAAHHRIPGGGRRIGRSESDDFLRWRGGRLVLEPGPGDPPQFQMYGMGATMYGDYEIGTLWDYDTDLEDTGRSKMCGHQESEFTYSRSGLAWHRPFPGRAFLPHGAPESWDCGNLQAASAPVFLEDEIRYYYAASNVRHARRWELTPGRFGVGVATIKPDRFIALVAGDQPGIISTRQFALQQPEIRINAEVREGGRVRLEILDAEARPIAGYEMARCAPVTGDSLGHLVRWQGAPDASAILNQPIRWRLEAVRARIYSVWMPEGDAAPRYHRFRSPF